MKLKPGASLKDLSPQMAFACIVVNQAYLAIGVECTITSGNDSRHSAASLHYSGNALDFRVHDVPSDLLDAMVRDIKSDLGDEFDVLLEGKGTPNAHIHIEFDHD